LLKPGDLIWLKLTKPADKMHRISLYLNENKLGQFDLSDECVIYPRLILKNRSAYPHENVSTLLALFSTPMRSRMKKTVSFVDKKTGKLNLESLVGLKLEARDRLTAGLDAAATISKRVRFLNL
jgi:hypothetical protein